MRDRRRACLFVLIAALGAGVASGAQSPVATSVAQFLEANFPGQAFQPCPGADDRFAPPTIWVRLKNAQDKPWSNGKTTAWLAFSDGRNIYDAQNVPIVTRPISLASLKGDKKQKWGVALTLAGAVEGVDVDATADLAITRGLEVTVLAGEAEILYGYYGSFLVAQEENASRLLSLNNALKKRFKGSMPDRRVVTGALRVRNASVEVKATAGFKADANADLVAALSKFGVTWDSQNSRFLDLKIGDDWRFLGFQALLADKETGKIGTAEPGTALVADDFAVADEYPWLVPEGATLP